MAKYANTFTELLIVKIVIMLKILENIWQNISFVYVEIFRLICSQNYKYFSSE